MDWKGNQLRAQGLLGNHPKPMGLLGNHPGREKQMAPPKQPLLPQPKAHPLLHKKTLLQTPNGPPLLNKTPPKQLLPHKPQHHTALLQTPQSHRPLPLSSPHPYKPLVETEKTSWKKLVRKSDAGYNKKQSFKKGKKNRRSNRVHKEAHRKTKEHPQHSDEVKGYHVEQDDRTQKHHIESYEGSAELSAYEMHKERLKKAKLQRSNVPSETARMSSPENENMPKDQTGDLHCLASYLLQIKSFCNSASEVEDLAVMDEDHGNDKTLKHERDNPSRVDENFQDWQELDIADVSNETAINKTTTACSDEQQILEDNFSQTCIVVDDIEFQSASVKENNEAQSNTQPESLVLPLEKATMPDVEEQTESILPIPTEATSKSKKHKIQLSNYASGNGCIDTNDKAQAKRKKVDSAEKLDQSSSGKQNKQALPATISTVFKTEESVQPMSGSITKPTLKSEGNPLVNVTDTKQLSKINGNESVVSQPLNSSAGLPVLEKRIETQPDIEPPNNAHPEPTVPALSDTNEKKDSGKAVQDLPFIIPVSGYFCDLCCDFFFDEDSTFEHCESRDHCKKVKLDAKKNSPTVKNPPVPSDVSTGEEEETVIIRRKKEKPSTRSKGGTKSPFLHPRIQPQKTSRKTTKSASPANEKSPANQRRKSFDWNFVIPKRK